VFTGTGRGFLAGVNIRGAREDPTIVSPIPEHQHVPVDLYSRLRLHGQELPRAVRRLDKLTVAAVNGYAIQLGLSLVLACDFAVAARSAQFGSATLRMGWQPDEGGHWLPRTGACAGAGRRARRGSAGGDAAAQAGGLQRRAPHLRPGR
jgi:2-(1,2-epoxy-1,2-dihydrophenyl)acetyl-CoA isomerase